jgi:hypothetical protein
MSELEFHFDFGSPNAYLAHLVIPEIERRTGARFEYVPVLLGGVFKLMQANELGASRLDGGQYCREMLVPVQAGFRRTRSLGDVHRHGEIHDSVLHALETELDLQEIAARRYTVDIG